MKGIIIDAGNNITNYLDGSYEKGKFTYRKIVFGYSLFKPFIKENSIDCLYAKAFIFKFDGNNYKQCFLKEDKEVSDKSLEKLFDIFENSRMAMSSSMVNPAMNQAQVINYIMLAILITAAALVAMMAGPIVNALPTLVQNNNVTNYALLNLTKIMTAYIKLHGG